MQKAQKPLPSAPLPLWGFNDKPLTGHNITTPNLALTFENDVIK